MKKLLIILSLVATPAAAQDINYYAQDFPTFYAQNPGSETEKKYNAYIKAADERAKFLATCKTCKREPNKFTLPLIRIPKDDKYVPICAYGSC